MTKLFEPLKINGMQIKNRFVRSATMDHFAQDGMVSEKEISLYGELAKGEVGLIISHGLCPSSDGWVSTGQLCIDREETIPSLAKLTKAVHDHDGKIAAQIMHGGWFSNPTVTGCQVVGPSAMVNPANGYEARELKSEEIYRLVEDHIQAGRRAIEAGFDAVQFHCAHGWFLSTFLSPVTNLRQDEWGGSTAKRANFMLKVTEGLRKIAGPSYPIFIKMGLKDYHPKGQSAGEAIEIAKLLEAGGMDAFELSEGVEELRFHHVRDGAVHPYYTEECIEARKSLRTPVILVGGMREKAEMEKILTDNIADAVALCRPFIMDPHLVRKLRTGETDRSDCISCNECLQNMRQRNMHCPLVAQGK